jgi:hypothetical protein
MPQGEYSSPEHLDDRHCGALRKQPQAVTTGQLADRPGVHPVIVECERGRQVEDDQQRQGGRGKQPDCRRRWSDAPGEAARRAEIGGPRAQPEHLPEKWLAGDELAVNRPPIA